MILVRGKGPDLVMIHGWGMHSGCWGAFADRLATRFTLHLVDLPGHGPAAQETTVQAFHELAFRLLEQLPTAAWLGWSLGGQIALHAALKQPGAVSRLVLIGTNPGFVASNDWQYGMDPQVFAEFSLGAELQAQETLARFNGLQVAGSQNARQTLQVLRDICAQAPPTVSGLMAGLELLAEPGMVAKLHRIQVPALVIGGNADRLVPLEAMRATVQLMPKAALVAIEGAGHAPFISHGAEVLEAICGFLARDKAA